LFSEADKLFRIAHYTNEEEENKADFIGYSTNRPKHKYLYDKEKHPFANDRASFNYQQYKDSMPHNDRGSHAMFIFKDGDVVSFEGYHHGDVVDDYRYREVQSRKDIVERFKDEEGVYIDFSNFVGGAIRVYLYYDFGGYDMSLSFFSPLNENELNAIQNLIDIFSPSKISAFYDFRTWAAREEINVDGYYGSGSNITSVRDIKELSDSGLELAVAARQNKLEEERDKQSRVEFMKIFRNQANTDRTKADDLAEAKILLRNKKVPKFTRSEFEEFAKQLKLPAAYNFYKEKITGASSKY